MIAKLQIISPPMQWSNKEINNVAYSIIPNVIDKDKILGEYYKKGDFIDNICIPVPGLHNLSNITAALAASRMIGVSYDTIKILIL